MLTPKDNKNISRALDSINLANQFLEDSFNSLRKIDPKDTVLCLPNGDVWTQDFGSEYQTTTYIPTVYEGAVSTDVIAEGLTLQISDVGSNIIEIKEMLEILKKVGLG